MTDILQKFAVLGDIHANLEALVAVMEDARDRGCTRFACVGDLVGYNANPRECLDIIRRLHFPCVRGNHDEYAITNEPLEGLNPRASSAMRWTREQLTEGDKAWLRELRYVRLVAGFSLVHATLDSPNRWGYVVDSMAAAASFTYQNTSVCFYGHTHLPVTFVRNGSVYCDGSSRVKLEPGCKYLINVGSVGEPRDGSPLASYVTFDMSARVVEFHRVSFDSSLTEAKLREAGLPVKRRRDVVAS
jgi:predicted phosphodiesterase